MIGGRRCRRRCCHMRRCNGCARRQANLLLVLACDVPSHRIVARERALAERTWHTNALMPLPDVRAQIRLVAVESIAVQAFQFLAIRRVHAVLVVHFGRIPHVQHVGRSYRCSQIAGQRAVRVLQILEQRIRCRRRCIRVCRWRRETRVLQLDTQILGAVLNGKIGLMGCVHEWARLLLTSVDSSISSRSSSLASLALPLLRSDLTMRSRLLAALPLPAVVLGLWFSYRLRKGREEGQAGMKISNE